MLSLPKTRGMCKIQTIRSINTVTPTKAGRLELIPFHAYDLVTKKWIQIDEDIGKALFRNIGILSSPGKTDISTASESVL